MATPEQIRQGIGEGWVVADTLTLEAYVALATLGSNTPPRAFLAGYEALTTAAMLNRSTQVPRSGKAVCSGGSNSGHWQNSG